MWIGAHLQTHQVTSVDDCWLLVLRERGQDLVAEVVVAKAIFDHELRAVVRAYVVSGRLELVWIGVRVGEDRRRAHTLTADLVDQAGVEVLNRQHAHGCGGTWPIDLRTWLANNWQSVPVELERKALVDATHLDLAGWIEDPRVEAVREGSCAVDAVPDQGTGAGLLG